ncbi:MAG: hypothetical protein ACREV5_00410 [Steroidobacter sp.]
MPDNSFTRSIAPSGAVKLSSSDAEFVFSRPGRGILLIEAAGHDAGQFGSSTLDEIASALLRERPLELFVDTRAAVSVAPRVRDEWTGFFSNNRADLIAVHVLTSSKFVRLAIAVAQLFSKTGNLIRLYSAPTAFEAQLEKARARTTLPARPQ